MKRTLERELKVPEIPGSEADEIGCSATRLLRARNVCEHVCPQTSLLRDDSCSDSQRHAAANDLFALLNRCSRVVCGSL